MGEDAEFEVAAEFPLAVGRRRAPCFVLRPFEPGGQMRLHGALGLAETIGGSARSGARNSCGGHGHPDRVIGMVNGKSIPLSTQAGVRVSLVHSLQKGHRAGCGHHSDRVERSPQRPPGHQVHRQPAGWRALWAAGSMPENPGEDTGPTGLLPGQVPSCRGKPHRPEEARHRSRRGPAL